MDSCVGDMGDTGTEITEILLCHCIYSYLTILVTIGEIEMTEIQVKLIRD